MLEDFEENEPDETEQQIRNRFIRERLRRARSRETIRNMVDRYAGYGYPISETGYIHGDRI